MATITSVGLVGMERARRRRTVDLVFSVQGERGATSGYDYIGLGGRNRDRGVKRITVVCLLSLYCSKVEVKNGSEN